MYKKIFFLFFTFLGLIPLRAQVKNGVGLNANLGTNKRMNVSLCYERKLNTDIFLRINLGYGNFIPFNTSENTNDLMLIRKSQEPDNLAKHLDFLYAGYQFNLQESKIIAPEAKIGVIWMLKKFQSNRTSLTGLFVGYQTSFSMVSQTYTNFYSSDSLRSQEKIEGSNIYYSWSPLNLMFGWKILIASNTTIDFSIDQSLGILFDSDLKYISEFYKNPYSGLQVDLSIGIRQLF